MRKFVFSVTLFLMSCGSNQEGRLTGLPSEDPIIAKIKQEFVSGETPKLSDLALGEGWKCRNYMAVKGNFSYGNLINQSQACYNFVKINGLIQNIGACPTKDFVLSQKALVGMRPVDNQRFHQIAFRVAAEGSLVGEMSLQKEDFKASYPIEGADKSTINPSMFVYMYLACTK